MALDVLTQEQIQMLKVAVINNIPVLITGDQHFPTGKSYLCDFLRNLGADVREQWEIEEGEYEDIQSNGKNSIYFTIALNQKLELETLTKPKYPREWRRFEVITTDTDQLREMEEMLDRKGLNRQDIALLLFTLRVRPEFGPKDFGV